MCLVVYLLLAAILTFGLMLYSAQTLQQAADVAAREIADNAIVRQMTLSLTRYMTRVFVIRSTTNATSF